MKRYDFKTYAFEANENVDFFYGNILDVGLMSKNGDYGFEEMINNVKITSSLYGDNSMVDIDVSENSLSDLIDSYLGRDFKLYYYSKCVGVENLSGKFAIYKRDYESDIEGALLDYDPNPSNIYPIYRNNIQGDKFTRLLLRIEIGDYRLEQYYEDIKNKEMIQWND